MVEPSAPQADTPQAPAGGQTAAPPRRRIVLRLLLLILVFVGGFITAAALQPDKFHVTRSTSIAAPPEQVFAHVNDLHKWEDWSPWAKLDPNAKNTFEGPDAGEGAVFMWSGNDQIGEGKMTVTDSHSPHWVRMRLEFVRPMEDRCDVDFTFFPQDDQTKVTWTMSGENNFMGKVFCLLMNIDKKLGGEFEQGLASMKSVVEAEPAKPE